MNTMPCLDQHYGYRRWIKKQELGSTWSFLYVYANHEWNLIRYSILNQKHFQQYIDYCHALFVENDRASYKISRNVEQQYRDKTSIWWYTLESFFYILWATADYELTDVDIVIKMGFFIKDLHRHIEELRTTNNLMIHNLITNLSFNVDKACPITELEQLTKTKGRSSFHLIISYPPVKTVQISLRFAQSCFGKFWFNEYTLYYDNWSFAINNTICCYQRC